ncbi:hypothetical protein BOX15_Mlig032811g1 [Macrostomum lignano]|uniref:Menorin-like domain-containing protein n=2 Tax=Macrostomum lignano TaxID=282301 RepID=A0A267DNG8_9PLAT|nr:hypothetical protein BOX15_Mlig032811g1 [Macrostomum lignano]
MAYAAGKRPQFVANPLNPVSYLQLFPRSTQKYIVCYMLFWVFVGLYFIYTGLAVYLFKMAYSSVFEVKPKQMHDILSYFPEVKDDATKITWSHATNSKKLLHDALNGPNRVMVLESDVLMKGAGTSQQELLPIMAHPPDTDSDLTFDEYLATVAASNSTVGIKLDFKAIEVVELCLQRVARVADRLPGPVIVNADILRGPGAPADKEPIDHRRFLRFHSELTPRALLSVGWTTGYSARDIGNRRYGWEHVVPMWELVTSMREKSSSASAPSAVTFPVRASLLSDSLAQLCWLVEACDAGGGATASLTVWMAKAPGEPQPEAAVLRRYRTELGSRRLFVDLPGLDVSSIAARNASLTSSPTPPAAAATRRLSNATLVPLQPADWTIVAFPPRVSVGLGRACVATRASRLSLQSRDTPSAPTALAPLRLVGDAQFGAGPMAPAAGVAIGLMDGGIRVHIDVTVGSVSIVEFDIDGSTERQRRRAELSTRRTRSGGEVWYSLEHRPDSLTVEVAFPDQSGALSDSSLKLSLTGLLESRRNSAYAPLVTLGGGSKGGKKQPLAIMALCHLSLTT